MKHFLFPFLFIFSLVVAIQSVALADGIKFSNYKVSNADKNNVLLRGQSAVISVDVTEEDGSSQSVFNFVYTITSPLGVVTTFTGSKNSTMVHNGTTGGNNEEENNVATLSSGQKTYIETGTYKVKLSVSVARQDDGEEKCSYTENYQLLVKDAAPLPVVLVSFSVKQITNTSNLLFKWETASEVNSKDFSIQGSTDGTNFITITTIPANGSASTYSTTTIGNDKSKFTYFRLKISDTDNSFQYSPTLYMKGSTTSSIISGDNNNTTKLVVVKGIEFEIPIAETVREVVLTDSMGRKVEMATDNFPNGVYIYTLYTLSGKRITKKIYYQ